MFSCGYPLHHFDNLFIPSCFDDSHQFILDSYYSLWHHFVSTITNDYEWFLGDMSWVGKFIFLDFQRYIKWSNRRWHDLCVCFRVASVAASSHFIYIILFWWFSPTPSKLFSSVSWVVKLISLSFLYIKHKTWKMVSIHVT